MVHSLDFTKNFQSQHCLTQQNIKRKFCNEEETIRQEYIIKRRYIKPIKTKLMKKSEEGPAFFPNTGAYGYCYAINKSEENSMMVL
ncbi:hypothetical protein PIROE2DRAFT_5844 [Piromyces sp. E2]|nr:hypothetical protein PIROE2DRAFT_5844 [Piromyces sp. E2]|eukprot:OUM66863.1 hypothetical protein PIROE2DRAFT_5844 [Piromyces sp. E2]